jgi:hypothetical protein
MQATTDDINARQPLIMRILVRRFVYRRPRAWGAVCLAAAVWVFILGVILCSFGFWWGTSLMAVAALELRIAYRLLCIVAPGKFR